MTKHYEFTDAELLAALGLSLRSLGEQNPPPESLSPERLLKKLAPEADQSRNQRQFLPFRQAVPVFALVVLAVFAVFLYGRINGAHKSGMTATPEASGMPASSAATASVYDTGGAGEEGVSPDFAANEDTGTQSILMTPVGSAPARAATVEDVYNALRYAEGISRKAIAENGEAPGDEQTIPLLSDHATEASPVLAGGRTFWIDDGIAYYRSDQDGADTPLSVLEEQTALEFHQQADTLMLIGLGETGVIASFYDPAATVPEPIGSFGQEGEYLGVLVDDTTISILTVVTVESEDLLNPDDPPDGARLLPEITIGTDSRPLDAGDIYYIPDNHSRHYVTISVLGTETPTDPPVTASVLGADTVTLGARAVYFTGTGTHESSWVLGLSLEGGDPLALLGGYALPDTLTAAGIHHTSDGHLILLTDHLVIFDQSLALCSQTALPPKLASWVSAEFAEDGVRILAEDGQTVWIDYSNPYLISFGDPITP